MDTEKSIAVLKFGGTSVATTEARELVYRRIIEAHQDGYAVVVVISAMGRRGAPYATDTLLDLVRLDCSQARRREQDLLFSCGEIIAGTLVTAQLQQRGYRASYLTGQQAGLITTSVHGDARILNVQPDRIRTLLGDGEIVVVAGGQGATPDGEITSLGRGGSDTTACALGVALDAAKIVIYTDVEGIMTADPRLLPEAQLLPWISHEHCLAMAAHGAKVMHPRAVETAAQKPTIPLWVRSTFSHHPGTRIGGRSIHQDDSRQPQLVAVAVSAGETFLRMDGAVLSGRTDLRKEVAKLGGFIVIDPADRSRVYVVPGPAGAEPLVELLGTKDLPCERLEALSSVSVIGEHLAQASLVTAIIEQLSQSGTAAAALTVSDQVITVWVDEVRTRTAAQAVHQMILASGMMPVTA